ncbi:MAG: restriction endonuclease subunit S [Magnetococcales bacterium]|nr:restriction endonuclease subunit S [Magnetococcales bacterium]
MIQIQTPQGWKQKPLKGVAEIERQGIQPDHISPDAYYVGLEHVDGEGNFIAVQDAQSAELKSTKFAFSDKHILYGKLRPYLRKISRPEFSGVCSTDILPIRPKNGLERDYLFHYLRQQRLVDFATARCTGINLPRLSPTALAEFPVIYPDSPNEQKRIAAILDKADAIRRKRRQALDLADQFLRSVFLDMFGDPVTNPKGWQVQRFENLGVLARGKSKHRPRNAAELLGGPFPLIQTGDVANANHFITSHSQTYSELGLQQSKMWPAGTLCITIAANIADTAILQFDSCFPDSVVGFTPSELVKTEYIHMWLTFYQAILKEKAPESAQKNINLRILSELLIPTPPIADQERFCRAFLEVEQLKDKFRQGADGVEDTFSSLTQRAFRGEL